MQWRWAALKNGVLDTMAYRGEFLLQVLGSAAGPLVIQLLVWNALLAQPGLSQVSGFTSSDLILYALTSVLFSQVRGGDLDFELVELIRTGQLSQYLLRPVSVMEFVFVRGMGPRLLIATLCLIIGFCFLLATGHSAPRLLGGMVLALLGNLIHFFIGAGLASAAFYWEEAYSVLMVKNMLAGLLSGELFPLFLVPEQYAWLYKIFPFYLYVYGPTQYALGKWSHAEFFRALSISLVWLAVGYAWIKLLWGRGMRRYMSIGG